MTIPPPYHPIPCALHSELELAALRGTQVRLGIVDESNAIVGKVRNLEIAEGAEWLVLDTGRAAQRRIRLDRILTLELTGP